MKNAIYGKNANWINTFVSNRPQVVSVNGTRLSGCSFCNTSRTCAGFGPVPTVCQCHHISVNFGSRLRLFADDSVIYREIHNHQEHILLQQYLEKF